MVALVAGAGWAAWTYGKPLLEAKIYKPEVEVTQIIAISPGQAQAKLISTGYVVPQRVTKIGAKTPGRIKEMNVAEGDRIEKGFVIICMSAASISLAMSP